MAHRAYYRESIPSSWDMEITEQHVVDVGTDESQRLRHVGSQGNAEALLLLYLAHRYTNAFVIVYEPLDPPLSARNQQEPNSCSNTII